MRDENYYTNKRKNNTFVAVIITILVMLVLGLGGYIVYDKLIKNEETPNIEDNNNDNYSNDNNSEKQENLNLTDNDKIEYNKEIKDIWFSLYRILSANKNFDLTKLKSGENLIKTKSDKMEFLWEIIARDSSINKNKDVSGTGSISVKVSDFINKYKELFNEELTETEIKSNYTVKNSMVYGEYYTGFVNEFAVKTQKINKIDDNNYQLQTDFVVLENDAEAFSECSLETVVDCNESVKYGKLNFKYSKINGNNYLVAITFEK